MGLGIVLIMGTVTVGGALVENIVSVYDNNEKSATISHIVGTTMFIAIVTLGYQVAKQVIQLI